MPDVNIKLAASLRHAKEATQESPLWFAFVAKGTSDGALLVGRMKISHKEINDAKAACGGKQVFRGRCFGEGDMLICEVGKEPPGTVDKQVKAVIHRDAGMQLKVEFRFAPDLAAEEEGAEPAAIQAPAPAPAPPGDGAARFMARLKALLPDLQKAEAANHPLGQEVKLRAGEAQVLARNKDFEQANSALDRLEGLVKQVLAAAPAVPPVSPPAAPPRPAGDGATRFTARLKALLPDLQKAEARPSPLSRDLKLRASEAQTLARAKDFLQADAVLDQVEKLIKQILAGPAQPPPAPGGISLVKLGRARLEWIATRTRALGDMNRLKTAIQTEFKSDPQQQAQLTAALARLDAVFVQLNEDLGNELDNVLNEKDPGRRRELAAVANGTMKRFLQYVASDEIMAELDGNEVVPDIQIAGPVRSRLQEIAAALGQ